MRREYLVPLIEERRTGWRTRLLNAMLGILVILLATFLVFNMLVAVCTVEGSSMNWTLVNGETILLEKNVGTVRRGDIVTIGGMSDVLIIKRVIALEGDRLVFRSGEDSDWYVDLYLSIAGGEFKRQEEEYIRTRMTTHGWGLSGSLKIFRDEYKLAPADAENLEEYAIEVGKGECFVMGDNRGDSRDSRYYGVGRVANIRGKMFYKVPKDSLLERILLYLYRTRD